MRPFALNLLAVVPGIVSVAVSGHYALQDWASLNRAFARWEHVVQSGGSDRALMVAATYENAFRINCFADGVGALLGGIWLAAGVAGLCLLAKRETLRGSQV